MKEADTHTETRSAQTLDSLMSCPAIVYCYPFTKLVLLMLALTCAEWEGNIIPPYIIASLRCSPVSLRESTY